MSTHSAVTKVANLLFPYFLIIMGGVMTYSGTFDVPFTFDDMPSVVENTSIQNLSDLKAIWKFCETRFLVYLSFALNFHFHGHHPFGYHLVNLIIHILAALTAYWLVRLLFLTPELKKNPLTPHAQSIALIVSLLFVTHPIQTQAVTYIVQRTTSMASLFYMLSLALYIKARLCYEQGKRRHILPYIFCIIVALMAMFTKEISLTLPLCILASEYFFFSPSPRQLAHKLSCLWPILLLLPVVPITTLLTKAKLIEHMGLAAETDTISRYDYILTQFNVIKTYLRLLFLPLNQSVDYDYPIAHHFFQLPTFASFLLLLSLFVLALGLFRKLRPVSFGIIWFFLTLSVESSIIPIRDVIFEHRLYLPSMGIFLSITSFFFYLFGNRRKILYALFTVFICITSLSTIHRNVFWENQVLLWNDVVKKAPNKSRGYLNRGVGYDHFAMSEMALKDYERVMELDKSDPYPYNNRGLIYLKQGAIESAITEFNRALDIEPNLAKTYGNRAFAYLTTERYQEAYKDFYKAVRLEPKNAFYLNGLGTVCKRAKRYDLALLYFTVAINIDHKYVAAYINRGTTHLMTGRFSEALKDLDRAAELDREIPEIYNLKGLVMAGLSKYEKCVEYFSEAIAKNQEFVEAYNNRGVAYQRLGELHLALEDFNKAITKNSGLAKIYRNRAKLNETLGQYEEARMDCKRAKERENNGNEMDNEKP